MATPCCISSGFRRSSPSPRHCRRPCLRRWWPATPTPSSTWWTGESCGVSPANGQGPCPLACTLQAVAQEVGALHVGVQVVAASAERLDMVETGGHWVRAAQGGSPCSRPQRFQTRPNRGIDGQLLAATVYAAVAGCRGVASGSSRRPHPDNSRHSLSPHETTSDGPCHFPLPAARLGSELGSGELDAHGVPPLSLGFLG